MEELALKPQVINMSAGEKIAISKVDFGLAAVCGAAAAVLQKTGLYMAGDVAMNMMKTKI